MHHAAVLTIEPRGHSLYSIEWSSHFQFSVSEMELTIRSDNGAQKGTSYANNLIVFHHHSLRYLQRRCSQHSDFLWLKTLVSKHIPRSQCNSSFLVRYTWSPRSHNDFIFKVYPSAFSLTSGFALLILVRRGLQQCGRLLWKAGDFCKSPPNSVSFQVERKFFQLSVELRSEHIALPKMQPSRHVLHGRLCINWENRLCLASHKIFLSSRAYWCFTFDTCLTIGCGI